MYVIDGPPLFRLLGDEARLRLLRALARERFNVTELTGILGLAQSGVSRHLGLLRDAGLVVEERDGLFAYYRLSPELADRTALWALLRHEFEAAAGTAAAREDQARLQEVLRLRRENFEQHAGPDARDGRQLVPGRSWAAWSRALGLLLPPLEVVDIGCGEGYLTIEAARWARRVVAVDRSATVLARARDLAARRRRTNITWKKGAIEKLPLADGTMDVALLSQALHHAADPAAALAEAVRVLGPGGRVLILDLREHGEAWVREKLGDRWQGFSEARLRGLLGGAGLEAITVGTGARRTGDPFTVLVAAGTKPNGGATRPGRGRLTRAAPRRKRRTPDQHITR